MLQWIFIKQKPKYKRIKQVKTPVVETEKTVEIPKETEKSYNQPKLEEKVSYTAKPVGQKFIKKVKVTDFEIDLDNVQV